MKKFFITNKSARNDIGQVSRSKFTFSIEAIIEHIRIFVSYIVAEIVEAEKHTISSMEKMAGDAEKEAMNNISGKTWESDQKCLYFLYEFLNNYLWARANFEESKFLIDRIKSDSKFADDFFMSSSKKKGSINTSRIRSRIMSEIHVRQECDPLTDYEVARTLYLLVWDEGTWRPLDNFNGSGSLFSWMYKITKNAMIDCLIDEGRLNYVCEKTAENTRIKKTALDPDMIRDIIDDNFKGDVKGMLTMVYVDKMTEAKAMEEFEMNPEQWRKTFNPAVKKLRGIMIRSNEDFENALSRKVNNIEIFSFDDYMETEAGIKEVLKNEFDKSFFDGIFGIGLSEEEFSECAQQVLIDIADSMPWTEVERYVWQKRYFENVSSKDVALELGMRYQNVDNIKSRLKNEFNAAVRDWFYDAVKVW